MGRSTIGDISTRLLTQFVTNLEAQLAATAPADASRRRPPLPRTRRRDGGGGRRDPARAPTSPTRTARRPPPRAGGRGRTVRVIEGPEAEPVNLLETAGTSNLIKIAVPVVILIAVIVALVVWLV